MKPVIPDWLKVTQTNLRSLDLGAAIKPFTPSEVEAGLVIRGPVIMLPTSSTNPALRKQFPLACHDVRFAEENGNLLMELYLGTNERRVFNITKSNYWSTQKRLVITTASNGAIEFRRFRMGDKSLYTLGPNFEAPDVDSFIKSIWDRGLI